MTNDIFCVGEEQTQTHPGAPQAGPSWSLGQPGSGPVICERAWGSCLLSLTTLLLSARLSTAWVVNNSLQRMAWARRSGQCTPSPFHYHPKTATGIALWSTHVHSTVTRMTVTSGLVVPSANPFHSLFHFSVVLQCNI